MTEPTVVAVDETEAAIQAAIDAEEWKPPPPDGTPVMSDAAGDAILDLLMADAELRGHKKPGGWKAPPNPAYHPCEVPDMTYADAGRPWECEECSAIWTLVRDSGVVGHVPLSLDVLSQTTHGHVPAFKDPGFVAEKSAPGENITKLDQHASSCHYRSGTGMCSCDARKLV